MAKEWKKSYILSAAIQIGPTLAYFGFALRHEVEFALPHEVSLIFDYLVPV